MCCLFTPRCWSLATLIAGLFCGLYLPAAIAAEYKSADDAYAVGAALARARNYAGSREPLEAALRLAPDDAYRLKVYEALMPAYRELPDTDKMVEAAEFVIGHADQRAKRSLESRSLASFLFQRGKLDEAIGKYEARLKERSDDVAALSILNAAYVGRRDNKERAAAVAATLAIVDKQIAARLAERLERGASADRTAAAAQYKDAATAWLEAGDTPRALAAAKKSQASPPEDRSSVLKYYWHKGLGDVFAAADQPADAKTEYEAALTFSPGGPDKEKLQKKLDEIKAKEKK